MYQPYFSKAAIQRLESTIQEKIDKFLLALATASSEKTSVDLSLGYSCLTSDVVMQYCYQKPFGALDAPGFKFGPILSLEDSFDTIPVFWYFPALMKAVFTLASNLPTAFCEKYVPAVAAIQWVHGVSHQFSTILIVSSSD